MEKLQIPQGALQSCPQLRGGVGYLHHTSTSLWPRGRPRGRGRPWAGQFPAAWSNSRLGGASSPYSHQLKWVLEGIPAEPQHPVHLPIII